MPIMAPLADTVGIPRSVVVCAYQWGQYAMLYLAPTGLVLATLTMLVLSTQVAQVRWYYMVLFVLIFSGILLVAQVLVWRRVRTVSGLFRAWSRTGARSG